MQYADQAYRALLDEHGLVRLMARCGNPYDHAMMESFMKTLTAEAEGSAFVPSVGALDDILCVHADRVVGNDNTMRYRGLSLQIPPDRHRHHYVKAMVRAHEYPDGTLAIFHGARCLARNWADGELVEPQCWQAA